MLFTLSLSMKFKDKKRTGFPVLFPHMVIVCSYLQISLAILSANTLDIQSKMNMATNLPSSLNCRIVPIKLITAQIYIILLLCFWYSTTNDATRIIPYAKQPKSLINTQKAILATTTAKIETITKTIFCFAKRLFCSICFLLLL